LRREIFDCSYEEQWELKKEQWARDLNNWYKSVKLSKCQGFLEPTEVYCAFQS